MNYLFLCKVNRHKLVKEMKADREKFQSKYDLRHRVDN